MQTFDMALFSLWKAGKISAEEALKNADSKNNLALRMRLLTKSKATAESTPKTGSEAQQPAETESAGGVSTSLSLELEPTQQAEETAEEECADSGQFFGKKPAE